MFVVLAVCGAVGAGFSQGSSGAVHTALRTAVVRGDVERCQRFGGPCEVGWFPNCDKQNCASGDRVAAVDAKGRLVAKVNLHHHRFRLTLVPGRDTLELLGDRSMRGHVFQRQTLRARAHHTTYVHFRFDVY
jgi:hypothetical protein